MAKFRFSHLLDARIEIFVDVILNCIAASIEYYALQRKHDFTRQLTTASTVSRKLKLARDRGIGVRTI